MALRNNQTLHVGVLALLILAAPIAAESKPPFLLVTEDDYEELRSRAAHAPWSEMKSHAIRYVNGNSYPTAGSASSKHMFIRKMAMCGALAYILDPPNKTKYKNRVRDALRRWDETRTAIVDEIDHNWSSHVPPGASFTASLVAYDIIHDDLTTAERNQIDQQLENIGSTGVFAGFPLNRYGYRLVYSIFTGDQAQIDHWLQRYLDDVNYQIRQSGVYHEGTGYGWARLGNQYTSGKSMPMDIASHTGTHDFYNLGRLARFYEWLATGAATPFRMNVPYGDSKLLDRSEEASARHHTWSFFSAKAGGYNAWLASPSTKSSFHADDILFTYLLYTPAMKAIAPVKPKSAFYENSFAAFWEDNSSDRSLMGSMWNIRNDNPRYATDYTHSQPHNNSVTVVAYGEFGLRQAGDGLANFRDSNGVVWNVNSTRFHNSITVNEQDHTLEYSGGVTEALVGGLVEYASGDTADQMPGGNHVRNFIMVHPQDGTNGYFVLFDEVSLEDTSDLFQVNLHPDSKQYNTVTPDREYQWSINRYSSHTVQMNIFLGTAPSHVSIEDGPLMFERYSGDPDAGYVAKYLEANYTGLTQNVVTVCFPSDSSHAKATFKRIAAEGCTGAEIEHGTSVVDYAMETSGTSDTTYANTSFTGKMALFRLDNEELEYFFIKDGTAFDNNRSPRHGFSSPLPITLVLKNGAGGIVSPNTNVTFYYPEISGILLDGSARVAVASGPGWVNINVPAGTHSVEFLTESLPPPDGGGADGLRPDGNRPDVDDGDSSALSDGRREGDGDSHADEAEGEVDILIEGGCQCQGAQPLSGLTLLLCLLRYPRRRGRRS